jgi:hypothetical protein
MERLGWTVWCGCNPLSRGGLRGFTLPIARMMDSVDCWDISKIKWVDSFKARDIKSKLLRVGAALMMGVNTTNRAKIMFGCHRVELIHAEYVRALCNLQAIKRDGSNDCATSTAHRTIATAGIINPIG